MEGFEALVSKVVCQALWGHSNFDWESVPTVNTAGGLLCVWGPKPFRVFDAWLSNKDYTKVVRDCWSANQHMGCKLQNLKHRLKTWSRDNCGDLGNKVKQTQKKINDLENSVTAHPSYQQVQQLKKIQSDLCLRL